MSAGMSLAIAACTGSGGPQAEAKPTSTPTYSTTLTSAETKPISTPTPIISPLNSNFELPFSGTWYFTKGPHSDDLSRGMRYALHFAPPEIIPCPSGKPLEGRYVTAAALGKVTVVGNEKDPANKNHSIVEIQHPNGYTTGYMHLENIKPRVGQEVKQGDILGNPSCEYPPGGKISVEHLQFYLKRAGLPVRISEISLSGYKITEGDREGLGNLSKPGEKIRTPDQRGCDNDKICGGIRNDLTSSSKPPSESVAKPAIKPKFEAPQPTAAPKPTVVSKPVSKPSQISIPNPLSVRTFSNPDQLGTAYFRALVGGDTDAVLSMMSASGKASMGNLLPQLAQVIKECRKSELEVTTKPMPGEPGAYLVQMLFEPLCGDSSDWWRTINPALFKNATPRPFTGCFATAKQVNAEWKITAQGMCIPMPPI